MMKLGQKKKEKSESDTPFFQPDQMETDWDDYRNTYEASSDGSEDGGASQDGALPEHVGAFPSLEFAWDDDTKENGLETIVPPDLLTDDDTGRDVESPLQPNELPVVAPEQRRLLGAWLARRRHRFGPNENDGSKRRHTNRSDTGPVDVDEWEESLPAVEKEDDEETAPTRHEDDKSAVSAATSDQTPVMGNVGSQKENCGDLTTVPCSSTGGAVSDFGNESYGGHDGNWRKKAPWMIMLLLVLFVVAVAVVIVSLVMAGQSASGDSSDSTFDSGVNGPIWLPTITPQPTGSPTLRVEQEETEPPVEPTPSPTVRTTDAPSKSLPTPKPTKEVVDTASPTLLPTETPTTGQPTRNPTRMPSSVPTHAETSLPTSVAPTMALTQEPSTSNPTMAPSIAPSMQPTKEPSARPTRSPTLQPSTLEPTTSAPTPVPSVSPTEIQTLFPTQIKLTDLVFDLSGVLKGESNQDSFGSIVQLSDNGQVLVVGAPNAAVGERRLGAVYIYGKQSATQKQPEGWVERAVLTGADELDSFGSAVAVNHDGSIVAVSEPTFGDKGGRVRVYRYTLQGYQLVGGSNQLTGQIQGSRFGQALALDSTGTELVVGAPYTTTAQGQMLGAVHVYRLSGNSWSQMGNIIYGADSVDWFGSSVDVSADGRTLIASAPRGGTSSRGSVRAFAWVESAKDWVSLGQEMQNDQGRSLAADRFGHSISLGEGPGGDKRVAVGIPRKESNDGIANAGMTVVYELDEGNQKWSILGNPIILQDRSVGDDFGYSVAFGAGGLLGIGAPGSNEIKSGTAYFFRFSEASQIWDQHPTGIKGSTYADQFGFSIALSMQPGASTDLAVGAKQPASGAGYVATFSV